MSNYRTIKHGMHDSIVWQGAGTDAGAGGAAGPKAPAEFFARANVMAAVDERGVHVSPSDLRPLIEQLDAEADRLFGLDDPTAPAFEAWSESIWLAERVSRMEPDYIG